jgi:hypothetical protein
VFGVFEPGKLTDPMDDIERHGAQIVRTATLRSVADVSTD